MKCVVGLSGGVDSATAALIMKEKGYTVVGCTLKMFESDHLNKAIDDAMKVAKSLKIDHEVIDCTSDFEKYVTDYFISTYENGLTPNPCITCNSLVKFEYLNRFRKKHNAILLVTGHYAQLKRKEKNKIELFQAEDLTQDQSYFLYRINRDILNYTEFPIGQYSKNDIRKLSHKHKIHVSEKKDSQDICFISKESYTSFIRNNSKRRDMCGDIVDKSGKILGKHKGIVNYTIGQRKGLGLSGGPYFVCDLDMENNKVLVSDKKGIETNKICLRDVKFINAEYLGYCYIKVRSIHKKSLAKIIKILDEYFVELCQSEYGVAKGQHCVFYSDKMVLGGGIIC